VTLVIPCEYGGVIAEVPGRQIAAIRRQSLLDGISNKGRDAKKSDHVDVVIGGFHAQRLSLD